jgi:hypothetical protein
MPNITVQPHVDAFLKTPSKRFAQDVLSVPLPYAAFPNTLSQEEWRKAAKFTSTHGTSVFTTVQSTTGYARMLSNGSFGTVQGSGSPTAYIPINSAAPPTDKRPSFYAVIPCDASGNLDGDLTYFQCQNRQVTTFDGTGLSSLTSLSLSTNQLTSFDSTGMSSLTSLTLRNNQLTSIDTSGLSSLTTLFAADNHLTSIDTSGMSSLTTLSLYYNQLTSFDGTGLSSLTDLSMYGNQLTSFDGTDMSSLVKLDLRFQQIASFENLSLPNGESIKVENNSLPASELDELYTALGINSGGLTYHQSPGIFVSNNVGTTGDDPSIATAKGHTVYGS